MPKPRAHWERVQTSAGWHLRLIGPDGSIILWSEVYDSPEEVAADHQLAWSSFYQGNAFASLVEVRE